MTPGAADERTEHLLREFAPQVLGAVIRRFHDFASAEDAVQEALLAAVMQWPREGLPDNPRGWLIQVASRRMTDHVRSETARRRGRLPRPSRLDQAAPAPGIAPERRTRTTRWSCSSCAVTPR
jgi:predicted RNA polymerase sigma factor